MFFDALGENCGGYASAVRHRTGASVRHNARMKESETKLQGRCQVSGDSAFAELGAAEPAMEFAREFECNPRAVMREIFKGAASRPLEGLLAGAARAAVGAGCGFRGWVSDMVVHAVDVDAVNRAGNRALFGGIMAGHGATGRRLIDAGVRIDIVSACGGESKRLKILPQLRESEPAVKMLALEPVRHEKAEIESAALPTRASRPIPRV